MKIKNLNVNEEKFDDLKDEELILNKEDKLFLNKFMLMLAGTALATACITYSIIGPRRFDKSNNFNERSVVISDEEKESIISNLEDTLDINIDSNYDDYLVLDAVNKNKNLNELEKNYFYGLGPLISDNPYIDREQAYKSLLNVDIIYRNRPNKTAENVKGCYDYYYEDISIYDMLDRDIVFTHEAIHTIYCNNDTCDLPHFMMEGVTEILRKEYFSDEPFSLDRYYPYESALVKMICEIVGSDKVLEAYSTGNMNIIYNELGKYGDVSKARSSINTINNYCESIADGKLNFKNTDDDLNNAFSTLSRFMTTKYADSKDEDKYLFYRYNEDTIKRTYCIDANRTYVGTTSACKAYFSKSLIYEYGNGVMKPNQTNTKTK